MISVFDTEFFTSQSIEALPRQVVIHLVCCNKCKQRSGIKPQKPQFIRSKTKDDHCEDDGFEQSLGLAAAMAPKVLPDDVSNEIAVTIAPKMEFGSQRLIQPSISHDQSNDHRCRQNSKLSGYQKNTGGSKAAARLLCLGTSPGGVGHPFIGSA